MPVSSRGYFVMRKEDATFSNGLSRTATTSHAGATLPVNWAYPAEEIEFVTGKEFIDFQEIRGSRQAYTSLDGPFRPTAMIKGAVYPGAALGQILYGALGDVRMPKDNTYRTNQYVTSTTTTASPTYDADTDPDEITGYGFNSTQKAYEMIFADGNTLPNFRLERSDGRDNGSAPYDNATIVEQIAGCKVESLQFTANFGEKVEMTANFQGAKRPRLITKTVSGSEYPDPLDSADIVYPGQESGAVANPEPLYFNRAAIRIDGAAQTSGYLKSVNFEMRNTITRQEVLKSEVDAVKPWKISETVDSYKLFEGGMECTLSGTAVFENTELYNKVLNGVPMQIELWLASNTLVDTADEVPYLLYFYWPKVKASRVSVPFRAGEVIESDIEFKVIYDPSATIGGFANPFPTNTSSSLGIVGGAMFAKLITHHPGVTSGDHVRPSFY